MRVTTLALFALLVGAIMHVSAARSLAKGFPDKTVVAGPSLDEPIEIVDPIALEFLGMKGMMLIPDSIPAPEVDQRSEAYAITRFGMDRSGKFQPFDELTYYPRPTGGLGAVYYHGLVGGASEYDRKWFRASICGDRILQAYIRREGAIEAGPPQAERAEWRVVLLAIASLGVGMIIGASESSRRE